TQSESGSWIVGLRAIRHNSRGNTIKKLHPLSYDELAIYIEPIDTLIYLTPAEVNGRDTIYFGEKTLAQARKKPACTCINVDPSGNVQCSECPPAYLEMWQSG